MTTTPARPVCQIGLDIPCGEPAVEAVAVRGLASWFRQIVVEETAGHLYVCAWHASTPISAWDNAIEGDAPVLPLITTNIVSRLEGLTKTVVVSLPDGPVYRETFHTSLSDKDCTDFALRGFADYQTRLINDRLDELEPIPDTTG